MEVGPGAPTPDRRRSTEVPVAMDHPADDIDLAAGRQPRPGYVRALYRSPRTRPGTPATRAHRGRP